MAVPTCRTWHLSSLKGTRQTVDHSPTTVKSFRKLVTDSGSAASISSIVSLADLDTLLEGRFPGYWCKGQKGGTRETDPWGTPLLTAVQSESTQLTITLSFLFASNFSIPLATLHFITILRTLCLICLLWGTLAKALRKSWLHQWSSNGHIH